MCTFAFWELILTSWSDYSRTPRKTLQENCVCLCILLLHHVSTCPSDLGLYYCSLDVVKLKGLASNGEYSCTFKSLHTCVYPNLFRFVSRCFNLYLWLVHSKRKKKNYNKTYCPDEVNNNGYHLFHCLHSAALHARLLKANMGIKC